MDDLAVRIAIALLLIAFQSARYVLQALYFQHFVDLPQGIQPPWGYLMKSQELIF